MSEPSQKKRKYESLTCGICFELYVMPTTNSTCFHTLCSECQRRNQSNTCPFCKNSTGIWRYNFGIQNILGEFVPDHVEKYKGLIEDELAYRRFQKSLDDLQFRRLGIATGLSGLSMPSNEAFQNEIVRLLASTRADIAEQKLTPKSHILSVDVRESIELPSTAHSTSIRKLYFISTDDEEIEVEFTVCARAWDSSLSCCC